MNFSIAWEGYILCKCSKKAKILHWYLVKQLDLRNFCLFGAILLMNFCNYMRETFCFFRVVLLMNFKFREILYKCSKKARSSCIQPICLAMAFGKVAWLTEIRAKEKFNSLLFLYPKKLLTHQLPILIIILMLKSGVCQWELQIGKGCEIFLNIIISCSPGVWIRWF